MLRDVLIWPDPRLKQRSRPVAAVDNALRSLIDDLFDTMYAEDGVGLAAPQVGVAQRIVVIDSNPRPEPGKTRRPIVLINPVLVGGAGEQEWNEGCLSVPGEFEDVERFETITVRALNREGHPFEITDAEGLLAVALQHEADHLDGTLFVDRLSTLKRQVIRRRMHQLKAQAVAEGRSPRELVKEREAAEEREADAETAHSDLVS